MARRPGDPRTRYVAFRVESDTPVARQGLIRRIEDAAVALGRPAFRREAGFSLTRYDGRHGIIRCDHTARDTVLRVIEAVRAPAEEAAFRLVPLASAGTLRALIEGHVPGLKEERDTTRGRTRAAREAREARKAGKAGKPGNAPGA